MNDSVSTLRLQDAWRESQRHAYHLRRASNLLGPILPMTGNRFLHLTDEQIQTLDQYILRFTKLQDAIGSRLYPALLDCLHEPYENRPMIDKLNRLEKLGYIQNATLWQDVRNIRNKFAHDYPDDYEKNAALVNLASEAVTSLCNLLTAIEKKLGQDHPEFDLVRALPNQVAGQTGLSDTI